MKNTILHEKYLATILQKSFLYADLLLKKHILLVIVLKKEEKKFLHPLLTEPNLLPHSYQFIKFFTLSVFPLTVCWTTHTRAIYQAVTMRVLSRFVDILALTAEH